MKKITMTELRTQPGEIIGHQVAKHGESFEITNGGKSVAYLLPKLLERMAPDSDEVVIHSDDTFTGAVPLTFRRDLGGHY